jgi:hypothetical protein
VVHFDEQSCQSFLKTYSDCDTFLAVMENSALHHVPLETIFPLVGAPPHFSCCVYACLDRKLPNHWIGREEPIF